MILNAYTVLDASTTVLRLLCALAVLGLGLVVWRQCRVSMSPECRKSLEDRSNLLFLVAILLLVLNLVSWPLFYMMLQSYVSEWPGIMCIYGVTQIGVGSVGPSRFLPELLAVLQATKPALVFLTGSWFVLYWLNRRAPTAPLLRRVVLALVLVGILGVVDAAAEGAYLVIPKKEELPSQGCCTMALDPPGGGPSGFWQDFADEDGAAWLSGAYYGVTAGLCLALLAYLARPGWRRSATMLAPLVLGTLLSVPVTLVFLVEIAAPALLHLPNHHCPYDLIPQVPESLVSVGLFVLGSFSVLWASVAGGLGRSAETEPFLTLEVGRLLGLGLFGYAGSLALLSLELALA